MKTYIATFILSFFVFTSAFAQKNEADFLNKIKPEYKLDLNPISSKIPYEIRKTIVELQDELNDLIIQQKKIDQEIAKMNLIGTPYEDNKLVKLELAKKYVNGQIAGREKLIQYFKKN